MIPLAAGAAAAASNQIAKHGECSRTYSTQQSVKVCFRVFWFLRGFSGGYMRVRLIGFRLDVHLLIISRPFPLIRMAARHPNIRLYKS